MNRPSPREMPAFEPIVTRKATDLIADQIRRRIFAREFKTGETLPSESELVRQTESSSASVRGALRALEAQGLIQMKSGRAGGAVVQMPGEDELAAKVSQLIRGQDIGLAELLEMQQALEPACAELAALNRTEDDITDLTAALEVIVAGDGDDGDGDSRAVLEAHSNWHTIVARASHNELLSGLMVALIRWIWTAVQEAPVDVARSYSTVYVEITRTIVDGDPVRARATMRAHTVERAEVIAAGRRAATGAPAGG